MRAIHKGKEPLEWARFRSTPGASYDDVDAPKDVLRRALAAEQHGLCCYCMGRIEAHAGKMKIEHWASQSQYPTQQLEYGNLLGACPGGDGGPPITRHCDTARGDQDLHVHPANPQQDCSRLFAYLDSGEIKPVQDDPRVTKDIETLVLNHPRLRAGRKERIRETLQVVVRTRKSLSTDKLLRMASKLEEPDEHGTLKPFCQAAIFWLRRQAQKRGAQRP